LLQQNAVKNHFNLFRPIEIFLPFVPTVDGTTIPFHFFDAIKKGFFLRNL